MISLNRFNSLFKHNIINTGKNISIPYKNKNVCPSFRAIHKYITSNKCKIFKCTRCNLEITGHFIKTKFKFYKKNILTCNDVIIKNIIE